MYRDLSDHFHVVKVSLVHPILQLQRAMLLVRTVLEVNTAMNMVCRI